MNEEEKILAELEKLEKESEDLLKDIDMGNLSDEDANKISEVLDDMFKKIKDLLEKSNEINDKENI